jgi:hypothetical protein
VDQKKAPEIQIVRVDDEFYRITVKRQDGTFEFILRAARPGQDDRDTPDENVPPGSTLQAV